MRPLLWCDLETTGLEPNEHLLLEIGLVHTNERLEVVDELQLVVGWQDPEERANDLVLDMHHRSGLFEEVRASPLSLREAEREALAWIDERGLEGLCMAGSCPHFDRNWLRVAAPALARAWSHRSLDLTCLRLFFGLPKRRRGHRALDDLHDDLADLVALTQAAKAGGLLAVVAA